MPDTPVLLVVDNDERVLRALKTKLERTGRFEILTASGGMEALRHVRERTPDLVVCDIDMPEMDGGELAAALRTDPATAGVPIVFLSALVSPDDPARDDVGGWLMLSKRSPLEHLVRKIEQLLARTP